MTSSVISYKSISLNKTIVCDCELINKSFNIHISAILHNYAPTVRAKMTEKGVSHYKSILEQHHRNYANIAAALHSQQTQSFCITIVRRPNVFDIGPTL